ncbi:MAG: hypothetical protein ACXWLK_09015 [Rhizomicrobium sp.]
MPPRTPHALALDIAAMASNMVALERAAERPELRRTFDRKAIGAEMIKLVRAWMRSAPARSSKRRS